MLETSTSLLVTPDIGELFTREITTDQVVNVITTGTAQTADIARRINLFGEHNEVPEQQLELARMAVARRVYNWGSPEGSLLSDWQELSASYRSLNSGGDTAAVAIRAKDPYSESKSAYGSIISGNDASIAANVSHLTILPRPKQLRPTLHTRFIGDGKLFLGDTIELPTPQMAERLQGDQLLPMLLGSHSAGKPLSSEDYDDRTGEHTAVLYYALGEKAICELPDYLQETGNFSDGMLLKALGEMGIPLRHSKLFANHVFSDDERMTQTEELREKILSALLVDGRMTVSKFRGQMSLYDVKPEAVAAQLRDNFETIVELSPSTLVTNIKNYKTVKNNNTPKPEVSVLGKGSIAGMAWERIYLGQKGYDEELVMHVLGLTASLHLV